LDNGVSTTCERHWRRTRQLQLLLLLLLLLGNIISA
jgi:hypothetical protein